MLVKVSLSTHASFKLFPSLFRSLCDQREPWRSLGSPFKHSVAKRLGAWGVILSRYRARASLDKLGMNSLTASAVLLASGSLGAFFLLPSILLQSFLPSISPPSWGSPKSLYRRALSHLLLPLDSSLS